MSSQAFISNATASTLAAVGDGYSVPRMPTAQRLAIVFGASDQGMMVYDTTLNNLFIWNGSAWESVPASGDAGPNGAIQYNDGGVVVGDANLTWDKTAQKLKVGGFIDIWKGNNGDTYSVGVGSTSLGSTQPGAIGNTAIGYRSQYRATTGSQNTSVGYNTLSALAFSGDSNTAVGFGAGNAITTGSGNVIVGGYSGNSGGLDIRTASNYVVLSDGNGTLKYSASGSGVQNWYVGGSVAMTLDGSSNLGIGVTPSAWGSNWKANHVGTVGSFASSGAGSAPPTAMVIGAYNDNTNWKYQFSSTGAARYEMTGANAGSAHAWYTSPGGTANNNITFTQAMTLDASGNLLVGTTSAGGNRLNVQTTSGDCTALIKSQAANVGVTIDYVSNYGNFNFSKSGTAKWSLGILNDSASTPTFKLFNDAAVGVYVTYGGTSWTATSDERLKDIIEPISNAVAKVGSLRSVIGKFKNDETNTRRSFLIAQDVQAVLPEAVDASNPDKLGVAYSEVIPLLVAAIKELTARVQTLETR